MPDDKKPARAGTGRKTAAAKRKSPAARRKPVPAAPVAPGIGGSSPLDGRPGTGRNTVVMVEHPHLGKITLRGDAADPAFADGVAGVVGAAPPTEANTVAVANGNEIHWLGPDEWLVVTAAEKQPELEASLRLALAGRHVAIVDTSDGRTTIRIHGARARDTLAKGCPLDLHPRAFGPGRCAQTLIARADVLIHQRDAVPTYDIHVACSYARYLWDWLVDAAREFD